MQKLNPWSGVPFLDANGDPYSGAQLFVYEAGTTTKYTTTKDLAGASNHANPIILNTDGVIADGSGSAQAMWQTEGQAVKLVLASSADTDPPASPLRTFDNIPGINDTSAISTTEWVLGPTPTYVSATSFTLTGDQTSDYHVGRRVKTENTGGTVYSTIVTSAYTTLTTITLENDSGSLDSGISSVSHGIISETNTSTPKHNQIKLEAETHDIASDADYTLTDYENLSGRYIITDTGVVLTTARNIIVSTAKRLFLAQNDTAETLTFKTSGGTGIAIPPGTTRQLLCDGTNVIVAGDSRLVAEAEVTGSAVTSVDFTDLDVNTHKSYRIEMDFEAAASGSHIYLYVNNDTTATNYHYQYVYATSTTVSGARVNNPSINYAGANSRSLSTGTLSIVEGYASGVFTIARDIGTTINLETRSMTKSNATVSNITQLTFTSATATQIDVGTKIRIYRGDL